MWLLAALTLATAPLATERSARLLDPQIPLHEVSDSTLLLEREAQVMLRSNYAGPRTLFGVGGVSAGSGVVLFMSSLILGFENSFNDARHDPVLVDGLFVASLVALAAGVLVSVGGIVWAAITKHHNRSLRQRIKEIDRELARREDLGRGYRPLAMPKLRRF